jgi:M6 family metalloprotease-like protein
LTCRRFEALLLIAISVSSAAAGLVVDGLAVTPHSETYEFIPPMPQFSSEAPELNFTIPFPVPRPSPIYGEISVLVIAVEFSDYNHTLSIEQVTDQTINRLNVFYTEMSYGVVSVVGKVAGWVRLPRKMAEYGADNGPFVDCQNHCPYPDTWQLFRDAAPMIVSQVNIAEYQQIVVLHAGYGEESSNVASDIWSVTFLGQPVLTPQGTFDRFSVVPEFQARGFDTLGVYAHEFGHLVGLPDLYSRTLEEVGPWDLMARGAWNGKPPGSSPAELLAWGRIFLSWITPEHIVNVAKQSRMNVTIEPIESPSSGVQAVTVQASPQDSKHYYLVEVRQQVGFDTALPSSGVLITYIDETKSNPVKVIDGVQTTSTLNDAPFQVGQKYSDSRNNLVISVVATNGSSFSVVVDTMAPSTDVAVESLTLDPPTVHPNNTASLVVRIANEGNLKAKPFLVSVYLNETLFASRKISLNAGEEQEIRLSWTPATGGTNVFKVVLDAENVLSETNKENNMKILRAVVGYALTLQLRPPGAGADLQWWISVNGVNQTYVGIGEFQIGVLPGPNTLEIQPLIYLNPSSRYVFRQWSDGVASNSRSVTVSSDMTLSVDFRLQFLLSLEPSGGVTSGGGWYDSGTLVTIAATSPSNVIDGQSRLVFQCWSGDTESNSTTMTVTMSRPYRMIANWKSQYYLNVQSPYAAVGAGWYDANAQAVVSLNSPVATANGVRYVFVKWSGDLSGANESQSITMSGPKFVSAQWETQYELKIESDYGHTNGAGWYGPGTQARFGVDTSVIDLANSTRRVFAQWSGDASGYSQQGTITMDSPKAIRAYWKTQYLVAFATKGICNETVVTVMLNSEPHQVKVPSTVELWLDARSSASFSTNATVSAGFRRYVFQEWKNSTGGTIESPQTVLRPEKYTAFYKELSLFPCIIATVTFGSEVTPEVQFLRNFRDHLVLSTHAGSAFMSVFNLWYYSFSPQVADFIVLHDIMRNPLRFVLYPLLGILELSSATYSTLSFAPEFAITVAGILASALIGLVYLTPIGLLFVRLLRSKSARRLHVLKACSISLLVVATVLLLGELMGSAWILAIATSALVLTTLISTPLLISFELASVGNRLKLLAKMKSVMRIS